MNKALTAKIYGEIFLRTSVLRTGALRLLSRPELRNWSRCWLLSRKHQQIPPEMPGSPSGLAHRDTYTVTVQ